MRTGDGKVNDGTRKVYSPWACSGSQLVASTSDVPAAGQQRATKWEQAASKCSQLSNTT